MDRDGKGADMTELNIIREVKPLGPPVETEEQARNWVIDLVAEVEVIRRSCDLAVMVPDQRKAFIRWMIKRGEALGVLSALKRCGRLGDIAYNDLRLRVLATQVPTVQPGVLPGGW
jgi:hypothetical protein